MAEFAKKLTVSFGAFSCTLSGFDNPFPVMRQVVDYFQELAARDPGFGAHPERPDTEALRAMAEKTSGMTVDAELRDDEVVLSSKEVAIDIAHQVEAPEHEETRAKNKGTTNEELTEMVADETVPEIDVTAPKAPHLPEIETDPEANLGFEPEILSHPVPELPTAPAADASHAHVEPGDLDDEMFEEITTSDIFEEMAENANSDIDLHLARNVNFEDVELAEAAQIPASETNTPSQGASLNDWKEEFAAVEETKVEPAEKETQARRRRDGYLVLGFGGNEGLDATRDIATSTPDVREHEVFSYIEDPVLEPEDEDFDWTALADAIEAAEEEIPPAEPVAETKPTPDQPIVNAVETPFLLTEAQQVAPEPNAVAMPEPPAPKPIQPIDLAQDDPRDALRAFARSMGAASLPELMEASAAYTTLVKGRPSFSRSEVLSMLDNLAGDKSAISQEIRIKTFGTLLRGGRIRRADNGEFHLSSEALTTYATRKAG